MVDAELTAKVLDAVSERVRLGLASGSHKRGSGEIGPDSSSPHANSSFPARQIVRLFEADPAIGTKKQLYVRLGCRGDWPELAAPGWMPPPLPAENSNAL